MKKGIVNKIIPGSLVQYLFNKYLLSVHYGPNYEKDTPRYILMKKPKQDLPLCTSVIFATYHPGPIFPFGNLQFLPG